MSQKNPLGPLNKRPTNDSERRNAERREAVHHAQIPYQKPRSYKWLGNLVLLGVVGALCYWLYIKFVPEEDRISFLGLSEKTITVDFTSIQDHLGGNIELVVVEKVPVPKSSRFSQQAKLFEQVLLVIKWQNANQSSLGGVWADVINTFPEKVYFTSPQAGRYKIGTSELKTQFGASNVKEMSHNLWTIFRDKVEAARPQTINQDIAKMREALGEERAARDPSTLSNQKQDDYNKARDRADLVWLDMFAGYINSLKTTAEETSVSTTVDPEKALKIWRAFIRQESPTLNEWVNENTISRTPIGLNDTIVIENERKTLLYLPLNGHGLYFFPTDLTSLTSSAQ